MSSKKLTKKQESDICLDCGECCRKYWITVFPEEVTKIAKNMKISKKKFLEEYCELFVKAYPKSTPGTLTYPTTFFPKRIYHKLEKEAGTLPVSFFIVPQIVMRRHGKACFFLNEDNSCKIYKSRPEPCLLFPFIAVPGYRENYPFCPLYKTEQKDYAKKSRAYFKKVKKYFKDVEKKGFKNYWKTPPASGNLFLTDRKIGKISLEEIEIIQGQYD